jgi:predicted RNA binding protein YcfA (HicA-like mRNA interferase family)
VGRLAKILDQVLRGGSDQNIAFDDLTALLVSLGFQKRIKGSHHVFSKDGVEEIINVQPSNHLPSIPQTRGPGLGRASLRMPRQNRATNVLELVWPSCARTAGWMKDGPL